ncbi:uncharacterized protein VTP21DRAFT_2174 [Calcarisporiella thermophila]|uniref:uncharacterized protein n=1 Tax=Calcarisporiella thermophila TaxID=911321 RepID=UPI003742DC44
MLTDNMALTFNLRTSRVAVLIVVSLALFIDMVVYGVIVPILPDVVKNQMGGDSKAVGFLFACYAIGLMMSTPIFAVYSDKYKNRRYPMLTGMLGLCISTYCFGISQSYSQLVFARIMQGVSGGATWTIGFSMLADVFPSERLGVAMGTALTATTMGSAIGPALGGFLYVHYGYRAPFIFCTALAAIDFFAVLWVAEPSSLEHFPSPTPTANPETAPLLNDQADSAKPNPEITLLSLLRDPIVLCVLVATALDSSVFSGFEPTLPLYLSSTFNANPTTIGLLFVAMVAPFFLSPLVGYLSDQWGKALMSGIGAVGMGCSVLLVAVPNEAKLMTLPLFAVGTTCCIMSTPLLPELGERVRQLGGGAYGRVYGLYNMSYSMGMAVGPILAGFLYDKVGFSWECVVMGSLLLCISPLLFWKMRV